jgi:DNA-binding NarL/FixJ family response regulator
MDKGIFQGLTPLAKQLKKRRHIMERENSINSHKAMIERVTSQQAIILGHIALGATDEEIAEKLGMSPPDIKDAIDNILAEIKAPNRLQAALWAAKNL